MVSRLVRIVEAQSAPDFLRNISPSQLKLSEVEGWIYRGVGSFEDHALRPSAVRGEPLWQNIGLDPTRTKTPDEDQWGYLHVEEAQLTRFYKTLDGSGLPIPGDQRGIREILRRSIGGETLVSTGRAEKSYWPPDDIINALALAQHYGLPTRLLDWTERALVAAYFAVKKVFTRGYDTSGRLAVWSLDYGSAIVQGAPDAKARLRRITVPAAGNPNLNAQRGLFTVLSVSVPDYDPTFDRELSPIFGDGLRVRRRRYWTGGRLSAW